MRVFLPLLCVLCATPLHGFIDGSCPRKDPPPGVLVLSPGSKLVVNCSGHVEVDGVKVSMSGKDFNNIRRRSSADETQRTTVNVQSTPGAFIKSETARNNVSEGDRFKPTETGENSSQASPGHTAPLTTNTVRPTSTSGWLKGESEEVDGEGYHEDEEEGGSRVTRGLKSRLQWKWSMRTVVKGDVTLERRGASLTLSSVRQTDSGRYTCYERGKERFSLKVRVEDPPETPSLSCYKRSPSSKIRCEWRSQKPLTTCYLLLSKSLSEVFVRFPCSYSSRLSRCWCALDHDENELRTFHMAYLCVTSIAGNATSEPLQFTPLGILKPDPPSDVSVQQEEGQENRMKVTWSLPISWKSQDNFFRLIYELQYKPVMSLFDGQKHMIVERRSFTITDALPGIEYEIRLRTKEDFDGDWSDWSAPVFGSSWTAKEPIDWLSYDLTATTFQVSVEGSTDDEHVSDAPESEDRPLDWEVSRLVLLIPGSFVLLLIVLAVYIFRHKGRFVSKLQSLSPVSQCGYSTQPQPSAPPLPEGQALVTFAPPHHKEPHLSEVEREEEEEEQLKERMEAIHFNNTSYFFLHQD